MEIGVGLPTNLRGTNKDVVLEWSQHAEAAGFASLCMGERLTYAGYDWVLSLTAAAAATSRIRLPGSGQIPATIELFEILLPQSLLFPWAHVSA